MSTADVRRGTKRTSKPIDRERKDRDDTQQHSSTTHSAQPASATAASLEELRVALSAIPAQSGYLITDHHATILAVSHSNETAHTALHVPSPSLSHTYCFACCCYTAQSSGLLAASSASASLFQRLLQDVRGLLDHKPERGREPVQSVTIDYATYRYTVTVTPQYIIAVHVTQTAATHTGTHAEDTGEGEADDEVNGREV